MRTDAVLTVDTGISLIPDHARTIVRFFVPGHEDVGPGDSRAAPVVERVMELSDDEAASAMAELDDRFLERHPTLHAIFERHASLVVHSINGSTSADSLRRQLLGAAFTHEYSIEGAALCNPSIVVHPHQPEGDDVAFVLSVRGIGEGHRSSIGFRTGVVRPSGDVVLDCAGANPMTVSATAGLHHRGVWHRRLADMRDDHENAAYVLDSLPDRFDDSQLGARMDALTADAATRRHTSTTAAHLAELADGSYRLEFPASVDLSERVLWPQSTAERNGMEDARFVAFTDGSAPRYCATYTAFNGVDIAQSLLTTDDFVSFNSSPMAGAAARGKGLALFPRQVRGRYVALSRADRETNSVAYSDDLHCWDSSRKIQTPRRSWEILQLGNCGSPIETSEGWLVLTHGVGPLRTYSIGALLLDLDEPHKVLAVADRPVVSPAAGDTGGYVPNVVYSCGSMAVGDRLVLPFGVDDQTISIVTLSIAELIAGMRRGPFDGD